MIRIMSWVSPVDGRSEAVQLQTALLPDHNGIVHSLPRMSFIVELRLMSARV
jgi:hypothetical protein